MKIALVSPYDFYWPGGVTAHISHLANNFRFLGHDVKILAPSNDQNENKENFDLIRLGRPVPVPSGASIARVSLSFWLIPKLKKILNENKFDVVHVHEPLAPLIPISTLMYSQTLTIGTFHAFHDTNWRYIGSNLLLKKPFSKLDGLIAVSESAKKQVEKFFPGKYKIIANGIDKERFSKAQPFEKFNDNKINILFVGRLEKRKGLKYLLQAFADLRWIFPNKLRLIVVGPGKIDSLCHQILSERDMRKDVIFVGTVKEEDLPRYYKSSHIYCSPAIGKESFGIVLLEAMAAGLPIVASNIEGYSNVVTHGQEGLLFPTKDIKSLTDALILLIRNPLLRDTLSERGNIMVERYEWDVISKKVLNFYEEKSIEKAKLNV